MSEPVRSPDVDAVVSEFHALTKQADQYWAAGEINRIAPLYRRAHELVAGTLGPDHFLTARVEYLLGCLFAAQEKWADAVAAFRRADALALNHPDGRSPARADILVRLADAIFQGPIKGELEDRERAGFETMHKAIALLAPPRGPGGREYASALGRLAHWQYWFGHHEQSRPTYLQALDEWDRVPNPDRHAVAFAYLRLALIERKGPAAEAHFRRYLSLCEELHGPDHPETAEAACRLAGWYAQAGRPVEAEPLFRRAWDIWEAHGLTDSPKTEWMRNVYDHFRAATDQKPAPPSPEDAVREVATAMLGRAREKLARFERLLEPDDPDLIPYLRGVAICSPDRAERVSLWQRVIRLVERHYGPGARELIDPLTSLSAVYREAGDFSEAQAALDRVDGILQAIYGPDHPSHAKALEMRSNLAEARGEMDAADGLRQAALAVAIRHAAEVGDYKLAEQRYRYAHYLRSRGWLAEAEAMIRIGIVEFERSEMSRSCELADYYALLADVIQDQGRPAEATAVRERARKLFGK